MKNKIKLIDRLKSWLVTLGIASVFGLAALGVNAANSYQKASAYDYQDNGNLVFYSSNNDFDLLWSFLQTLPNEDSYHYFYTHASVVDDVNSSFNLISIDAEDYSLVESPYFTFTFVGNDVSDNYVVFIRDSVYGWGVDENASQLSMPITSITFTSSNTEDYQSLRNYALSYNASQDTGNFVTALTSFMSLIGGGIVQLAQTIGAGVVSFASGLFLDSGHLSILGGIIGIFAGIALAVGITSKVYAWVSTLGN